MTHPEVEEDCCYTTHSQTGRHHRYSPHIHYSVKSGGHVTQCFIRKGTMSMSFIDMMINASDVKQSRNVTVNLSSELLCVCTRIYRTSIRG